MRLRNYVLIVCCVLPSIGSDPALGQRTDAQLLAEQLLSPTKALEGHEQDVRILSFTSDGKRLASGAADGTICIWDVENGVQLRCLSKIKNYVAELDFSRDGKSLVASFDRYYDHKVRLWDVETGRLVTKFHQDAIRVNNDNLGVGLAFSPDTKMLAVASLRGTALTLRDAGTAKVLGKIEVPGWIDAFAFAPDGKSLAITYTHPDGGKGNGNTVSLWDISQRKQLYVLPKDGHHKRVPTCLRFSHDGQRLAELHENIIRLWDVPSRELLLSFSRPGELIALAFRPNGQVCVANGENWAFKTLDIWDVQPATRIARLEAADDHFMGLSFSPDGSSLATGMESGRVLLWDLVSPTSRPAD